VSIPLRPLLSSTSRRSTRIPDEVDEQNGPHIERAPELVTEAVEIGLGKTLTCDPVQQTLDESPCLDRAHGRRHPVLPIETMYFERDAEPGHPVGLKDRRRRPGRISPFLVRTRRRSLPTVRASNRPANTSASTANAVLVL
jgi:hypothetical protein